MTCDVLCHFVVDIFFDEFLSVSNSISTEDTLVNIHASMEFTSLVDTILRSMNVTNVSTIAVLGDSESSVANVISPHGIFAHIYIFVIVEEIIAAGRIGDGQHN